jgi:hypothetical protein
VKYAKSAVICRAALALAPLKIKINPNGGCTWAFGHRLFSAAGVNALILAGEAVRIGNEVWPI